MTTFPTPTLDRGYPSYGYGLVAEPGGGVLRVLAEPALQRIGARGDSSVLRYRSDLLAIHDTATILTNGSLALLAERRVDYRVVGMERIVVQRGSAEARTMRLPSMGPGSIDTAAIAPDGAVWRSRACAGLVTRTAPDGRMRRYELPRVRCRLGDWDGNTRFAFGPDGSVWYANLCHGRIVRFPLAGRRRTWRPLWVPDACDPYGDDSLREPPPALLPLPDGGLRFERGRIDARGRMRLENGPAPDERAADGTEWFVGEQTVRRRARDGSVQRFTASQSDGRRFIASTLGPDGRLWLLRARLADGLSAGYSNADPAVVVLGEQGFEDGQQLDGLRIGEVSPSLVPVADGVWSAAGWASVKLAADVGNARPATAQVTRVLVRRRAATWLQVACAGRPGTWCAGRVVLRGRRGARISSAERAVMPAGDRRAVRVTLGARARRALRGGRLTATAVVRADGGRRTSRVLRLR